MKIRSMKTLDFQGLKGQREFTFDKFNCYCLKQGAGKTSVLNAVRFAISGYEPAGETIYKGQPQAAVMLTTDDGTEIVRQKMANKNSVNCYIGNKKVSRNALDEAVSTQSGVITKTVRAASSADIMKALNPADFGELIRNYTPELLDTKRIKSYVPDFSPELNKYIDDFFPADQFGVSHIGEFCNRVIDERRALKREITALEAVITQGRRYPMPEKTKEELKAEEEKLLVLKNEETEYAKKKDIYDKAVADTKSREAYLKTQREICDSIKAEYRPNEERESLTTLLMQKRQLCDDAKKLGNTAYVNAANTKKILASLNTKLCPLSAKLVCTTDKSELGAELKESIASYEKTVEEQRVLINNINKEIAELEDKLKKFDEERLQYERKKQILENIKNVERIRITIPEEPKKPDAEGVAAKLKEIQNSLAIIQAHADANVKEAELTEKKKTLDNMEELARAFGPNGIVMSRITEDYMMAFEEAVNEKAKLLYKDMRVKFVSENGVHVYLDIYGDGTYLSYDSLSGGEKAMYIFLMLDLLNTLSQFRILFLDELSVLDAETFDALLTIIQDRQEEYDHIFIATVNHTDTIDIIKKHGIALSDIPAEK